MDVHASLESTPVDGDYGEACDADVIDRKRRRLMKHGGWVLGLLVLRCLVGMVGAGEVRADYLKNGNGTVSDTMTGLMWQQGDDPGMYTWDEALAQCEASTLAGYTDWRLPNVRELESLVDRTSSSILAGFCTIDTNFFPTCHSFYYWSGSSFTGCHSYAWDVYFGNGHLDWHGKEAHDYVRCVRTGAKVKQQGRALPALELLLF